MTTSQLDYMRLKFPFASGSGAPKIAISETDANQELSLPNGINAKFSHTESAGGKLVTRALFNTLGNFTTKVAYYLQMGGIPQLKSDCSNPTAGDPYAAGSVGYSCPDNAVLPQIDQATSRIGYFYYDSNPSSRGWKQIGLFKVIPNNAGWTSLTVDTGHAGAIVAGDNQWLYLRSICIPTFAVSVNGVKVALNSQNIASSLRYHGSVAFFCCLLMRKGDVCTVGPVGAVTRLECRVAPCVQMEGIG